MKKELIEYPYLTRPVSLYTLDNGHKIALAHKESALINISTWVKTGSINEDETNNGVSHFLEHLMFKGTTKYKAGEFDALLERKGGIINAATWKDYTFYYVTISKKNIDLAIELHSDMMIDPLLPEEEIGSAFDPNQGEPEDKRERYVVMEEIKMRNDQNWSKVYTKLNNAMYERHPYKRDVIGTPEIISQIPRDKILEYYNNFYTPKNLSTVVVGDFDEDEILAKVIENFKVPDCRVGQGAPHSGVGAAEDSDSHTVKASSFLVGEERAVQGGLMRAERPACENGMRGVGAATPELEIKNPQTLEQKGDVETGYLMAGFLCDGAKNLKETIALDLISLILGEGKSSRLNANLIESVQKPHYYSVDSSHYQFKDGDNLFINANFDPAHYDKIMPEIRAELEKLKTITEEELKKARKQTKVNFANDSETVAKISDSIGYWLTVCEDLTMANKYEKMLEEIDVPYLEEIVKKYLDFSKCSVSVLLPEVK